MSCRSQRKRDRNRLRDAFGDNCYWCGLEMVFPEYGKPVADYRSMATIEHHIQKTKTIAHDIYLRLVHLRCNK